MEAASRVEIGCPELFLPSPQGVVGLTTLDQYIYVFFPGKIKVYEQLPSHPAPDLVEEIYLSKANICRFAVSHDYIAVLFEDSALEVRLRQYWEVVQYCSCLPEPSDSIDSLQIDANKVYYRFKRQQEENPTFGFVDVSDKAIETRYWQQTKPLQKLIHRHKLGSIPDFYVSLQDNEIRFGMYYQEQPTFLKQFEFGILKQAEPESKVISIHLIEDRQSGQEGGKNLYLVKLVDEPHVQEKSLKKKKKHKNGSGGESEGRLRLKFIKFFEERSREQMQEENSSIEDRKFKVFQQMLLSMQQIQANTNCEKSDFFGNISNQPIFNSALKANLWMHVDLPIPSQHLDQLKILRKGSLLYFVTPNQILQFSFKGKTQLKIIRSANKDQQWMSVKQISEHGLILSGLALFTVPFTSAEAEKGGSAETTKESNRESQKKQSELTTQETVATQKHRVTQRKLELVEKDCQTEMPTDVFLDQFEEKQLAEIIDELFVKKKVVDCSTSTDQRLVEEYSVQTEHIDLQRNEMQIQTDERSTEEPISLQTQTVGNQGVQQPISQSVQTDFEPIKQAETEKCEKSVGQSLPLCPECHNDSLSLISKQLKSLEGKASTKWAKDTRDLIKMEQDRLRSDVVNKVRTIIESTVSEKLIPVIEQNVKQILDSKLTQINGMIYSLALNNNFVFMQEMEKDSIRENAIKNELIKRQMHEVAESKKAVAQMIEICKVKEIQKTVFFESLSGKFRQMEQKVIELEDKIKALTEAEEAEDAKIYQEIEAIKEILVKQSREPVIEDSVSSEQVESENGEESVEQASGEDIQEVGDSQEESDSSQEVDYDVARRYHPQDHAMSYQRVMVNQGVPMAPYYRPFYHEPPYQHYQPPSPYLYPYPPPPGSYYPPASGYPTPPGSYPGLSPFSSEVEVAPQQFVLRRNPSKKVRVVARERAESASIPAQVGEKALRKAKKKSSKMRS